MTTAPNVITCGVFSWLHQRDIRCLLFFLPRKLKFSFYLLSSGKLWYKNSRFDCFDKTLLSKQILPHQAALSAESMVLLQVRDFALWTGSIVRIWWLKVVLFSTFYFLIILFYLYFIISYIWDHENSLEAVSWKQNNGLGNISFFPSPAYMFPFLFVLFSKNLF